MKRSLSRADIARLVQRETDRRPGAFGDFLLALSTSAGSISNHYASKNNEAVARWWQILATELEHIQANVQRGLEG